jgi:hypothetical protein
MENWKRLQNMSSERLHQCRDMSASMTFSRFNNAVWLVMNDVILGSVFGAFVCENSEVIGQSLRDWLKVRHSHISQSDERQALVIIRYVGCLH